MSENINSRRIFEHCLRIAGTVVKFGYAVFFSFVIAYCHLAKLIVTNQYYEIYEKFIIIPILLLSFIIYAIFFRESRAQKTYWLKISFIEELFKEGKYQEALDFIDNEKEFYDHNKFTGFQRLELFVTYKVESLVRLGRLKEATIEMAREMSAIYQYKKFPEDLLEKWYELYGSCESILNCELDFGYFEGALYPSTIALINKTIDKGYPPPKGYLNYSPDSSLIKSLKGVYKMFIKAKT